MQCDINNKNKNFSFYFEIQYIMCVSSTQYCLVFSNSLLFLFNCRKAFQTTPNFGHRVIFMQLYVRYSINNFALERKCLSSLFSVGKYSETKTKKLEKISFNSSILKVVNVYFLLIFCVHIE